MIVVSLFDGVGGGLLALRRVGILVAELSSIGEWRTRSGATWRWERMWWCQRNCGVMHVTRVKGDEVGDQWPVWGKVDLLIMGFSCQGVHGKLTGA